MDAVIFEKLTHEGRKVCDREDLGCGYCGSVTLELHIEQLADPDSWVHSSKERWLEKSHVNTQWGILDCGAGI